MTNYDVVVKLLGKTEPIGDTNVDDQRYENLKATIELVDKLLIDLYQVAGYATCQEYSMSRSGKLAEKFLKDIKEQ